MTQAEAHALVVELAYERTDIDALLLASAGQDAQAGLVFRCYYVAARLLSQRKNTSVLREAEGAKFESPQETIRNLYAQQAADDTALVTALGTIPEAYAVPSAYASAGSTILERA